MISKICKDCMSNPFIVYEFYDRLKEIITYNNLNADDIWNMDETAFCLDPKKAQTIAPKGSKAYKITQGGGRENITVVGVVSASGKVMDPVIIKSRTEFPTFMVRRQSITQYHLWCISKRVDDFGGDAQLV